MFKYITGSCDSLAELKTDVGSNPALETPGHWGPWFNELLEPQVATHVVCNRHTCS